MPNTIEALNPSPPAKAWETVTYRGRDGTEIRSRFTFGRVVAARPMTEHRLTPRQEWLIIKWPKGTHDGRDCWLANLPADTAHERLARLPMRRPQRE